MLMVLQLDPFNVSSPGARVLVVCFGFLALLVMSTYTANLAAVVTVKTIKSNINNVEVGAGQAKSSPGCSPCWNAAWSNDRASGVSCAQGTAWRTCLPG